MHSVNWRGDEVCSMIGKVDGRFMDVTMDFFFFYDAATTEIYTE